LFLRVAQPPVPYLDGAATNPQGDAKSLSRSDLSVLR
jgi:hypothetical protein